MKFARLGLVAVALCAALTLGGCRGVGGESEAGDWPTFGRDGSEQHYSPLNEIKQDNVAKLKLAWHYDLEPGYSSSMPVAADGKL